MDNPNYTIEHQKGQHLSAEERHDMIYDGTIPCRTEEDAHQRLLRIALRYADVLPQGYHSRNVAPSDVIELYDDATRKFYYRDESSFWPVQFTASLAKQM